MGNDNIQQKNLEYKGIGSTIAFTNTDHYDPNIVGEYWFGVQDDKKSALNRQGGGHYLPLSLAIVKSGNLGTKYAIGLHAGENNILMKSFEKLACHLYMDRRGRLFFCVCKDLEKAEISKKCCKIFISYSHADSKYIDEQDKSSLLNFLKSLEKENVEFWLDRRIHAGDFWDATIQSNIESADIALVLVSQTFLNSQYCTEVEVKQFLEAQKKRGLRILPLILSACNWEAYEWLRQIQYLPRNGENIESNYNNEGKRKELYLEILHELEHFCHEIRKE